MPVIPKSAVTVRLQPGQGLPLPGAGAQAFARVAENAAGIAFGIAKLRQEETEARQEMEANLEITRIINDIDRDIASAVDPDGLTQRMAANARNRIGPIASGLSKRVAQRVEGRTMQLLEAQRVSALKRTSDLNVGIGRASLDQDLDLRISGAVNASNSLVREIHSDSAVELVGNAVNDGFINPEEAAIRLSVFARDRDVALVENAALSGDFESARALNAGLLGHSESDKISLERTIRVEENKAVSLSTAALRLTVRNETVDFMSRMNDPADPAGFPTVREVLDSELLAPNTMQKFIDVIEKRASGQEVDFTNPALTNDLTRRVLDDEAEDHISSVDQLLPFLGQVDRVEFDNLKSKIEARQDDARRAQDKMLSKFLSRTKPQITKATLFLSDPDGDSLFEQFSVVAERRFRERVKEGKDPLDLIDPSSNEYIGSNIGEFQRGPLEIARSMQADLQEALEEDRALFEDTGQHREGESMEDFLTRVNQ